MFEGSLIVQSGRAVSAPPPKSLCGSVCASHVSCIMYRGKRHAHTLADSAAIQHLQVSQCITAHGVHTHTHTIHGK